jgi:hypothetical protein
MKPTSVALGLIVGVTLGVLGTSYCIGQTVRRAAYHELRDLRNSGMIEAGTSDRYEDYVMCTGAVGVNPRVNTDGVWLLDYRAGKLLGTVIDRNQGKIVGWAELNLVQEFNIPPRQACHFMMTTGLIASGQSALYVAETTTGKFGVYTMGASAAGQPGAMTIFKHDMSTFRAPPAAAHN